MTHEPDLPPPDPLRTVARRVAELRRRQGWDAKRLGEEMVQAGLPWNRSIVANLESGRRSYVSVSELLALAVVFDVSPLSLLLPSDDGPYAVTAETTASSLAVYEWMVGYRSGPEDGPRPEGVEGIKARVAAWEKYLAGMPGYLADHERRLRDGVDEDVRERGEELEAIKAAQERDRRETAAVRAQLEAVERLLKQFTPDVLRMIEQYNDAAARTPGALPIGHSTDQAADDTEEEVGSSDE